MSSRSAALERVTSRMRVTSRCLRAAGTLGLISLVVLSCQSRDARESERQPSHDGAVRTIGASDLDASPLLTLEPEITIPGPLEGDSRYQLANVASVAVDDEGNLYVLDSPDPRLRVFAPDGTYRFDIGSVGDGPGEYQRPRLVGVRGDSVFVVHQRLETYRTDGEHLATVRGDSALWSRVRYRITGPESFTPAACKR